MSRPAWPFLLPGLLLLAGGLLSWWSGADIALHRALRLGPGPWDARVAALTTLGGLLVMGSVALAAFAWLLWRGRTADALWLFATIASGRLAVEGLKLLVLRPRPPRADWLEIVHSWSFPSAHSAGTMMTCVALALLFGRPRWTLPLALAIAAAIGWSRMALAVHWPGDVLAGWGVGLLWLGLAVRIGRLAAGRRDPLRPLPIDGPA